MFDEVEPEEEKVNRCDCINKTFEQLKSFESFEAAQAATGCGVECEGCVPYLKLMFATGETEFDIDDSRLSGYQ